MVVVRDSSVSKSTYCSSEDTELNSQHPHGSTAYNCLMPSSVQMYMQTKVPIYIKYRKKSNHSTKVSSKGIRILPVALKTIEIDLPRIQYHT
jgi:hypothetical protein